MTADLVVGCDGVDPAVFGSSTGIFTSTTAEVICKNMDRILLTPRGEESPYSYTYRGNCLLTDLRGLPR
jgi:hypothetical protein